jgi:hypothetical protein
MSRRGSSEDGAACIERMALVGLKLDVYGAATLGVAIVAIVA